MTNSVQARRIASEALVEAVAQHYGSILARAMGAGCLDRARAAISDVELHKSMSLERENFLRALCPNLPPLRVHHIETAAPKDTRNDVRARLPRELHAAVVAKHGSIQRGLQRLMGALDSDRLFVIKDIWRLVDAACDMAEKNRLSFAHEAINRGDLGCADVIYYEDAYGGWGFRVLVEEAGPDCSDLPVFIREYLAQHGYDAEVTCER